MGVILMDYNGSTFQGKITDVMMVNATKNSLIKILGANIDIIQKFGLANRLFTLEGFVTSSTGVSYLTNALNHTGSIYYSSSVMNMELIGVTTGHVPVYYLNLIWHDDGKTPTIRKFTLELVEKK